MTRRLKAVSLGVCACMLSFALVSAAQGQSKRDTRVFMKDIATGIVQKSAPMDFGEAMKVGLNTAMSSPEIGSCWLKQSRKFLSIPFIPWWGKKFPLTTVRRVR